MKLSSLKTDVAKIETGAWVGDIPEMGELRLRVRGLGNADDRRIAAKATDAIPRAKRQGGRIDPVEADRVLGTRLLDAILLDWDGLTDDEDQPLPYSREKASELLLDPEFRRFRDAVLYAATVVGDEAAMNREADAGN